MGAGAEPLDRRDALRRLYLATRERTRVRVAAQTAELDFALKMKHYQDDATTPDSSIDEAMRPRGRELAQLIDHNCAIVAETPLYCDVFPRDQELDPELAGVVRGALRGELLNPFKRYSEAEDNMVRGAVAARMWAMEVEFNPTLGDYGELVFRERDGRTVAWAPGFQSPHDPECSWVMIWDRVPKATVEGKRGWKQTDDLFADNGDDALSSESVPRGEGGANPIVNDDENDLVTVVKLYERGVEDRVRYEVPGSFRKLPVGERYMQCGQGDELGCGYQTLKSQDAGEVWPESKSSPDGCPKCGRTLTRTDGEIKMGERPFKQKRRFTIFMPLQAEVRICVERDWPFDTPSVPLMVLIAKQHPAEPIGSSWTSENWWMQLASDWVLRMGIEQLRLAKPYHLLPRGANAGLEDAAGNPWAFGDEQGLGIFYTGQLGPNAIQTLQGSGLPASWNTLMQAITMTFKSNMGSTDIGLTPTASRDIAVGTVKELIASAELPTQHLITKLQRARTIFWNVVLHLIGKTYNQPRWVRTLGENGQWRVLELYGWEIPAVDVVAMAEPTLAEIQNAELQNMIEYSMAPWPTRRFIARLKNLDRQAIRELEADEKQFQAEQEQREMRMAMLGAVTKPLPSGGNGSSSHATSTKKKAGGATHGALTS